MSTAAWVALAAAPWIIAPTVGLLRLRGGSELEDYSADVPADAPLVSVIVPARDEARNIAACLESVLSSRWRPLEVIAVDDNSSDGTGVLARAIAQRDSRVRVIDAPPLPEGWMGKQWACHTGAKQARGEYLLFIDADTRHTPDLIARAMAAKRERRADLMSIAGVQLMESFWERLIQPHIFWFLALRYGHPDAMSRSTRPLNKIANGQFILVSRETYDAEGGHEGVKGYIAEDLRIAQDWTRRGRSVQIVATIDGMRTRMYHGLGEIARGWGKNIYAAGRDTVPWGPFGQFILRLTFPFPSLWEVVPAFAVLAWSLGLVSGAVGAWGAVCWAASALARAILHHAMRAPIWMAALVPVAAFLVGVISARAAWRGSRVEWRGRAYTAG